jgi:hypothetical protein
VVQLQAFQPFRRDALSYLAMVYNIFTHAKGLPQDVAPWVRLSPAISLLALVAGLGLTLRTLRPSPASFAAAVSVVFLLFFAFNKQAFCNYYYFVLCGLCCTIAATRFSADAEHADQQCGARGEKEGQFEYQ